MHNHDSQRKFIKGLMAGAVVGAVAGFLIHKNRRRIMSKVWMIKARAEIYRRLGDLTEITKSTYEETINAVAAQYRKMRNIAADEVDYFAERMMDKWKEVKAGIDEKAEEALDALEEDDDADKS
jgi:gas vesicle protein